VSDTTRIILIAAIGKNNELGKNNDLLWRLKSDMHFFKSKTSGHCVIMGRKSWDSLPQKFRPLPNRINIVVSRDSGFFAEGARVFSDIHDAIVNARKLGTDKIFIIGGAQIYKLAIEENLIDEMYLTHVEASFNDADVFFPQIDNSSWNIETIEDFPSNSDNEYSGVIKHYQKNVNRI
jgi:dihydrofolate reductase